MTVVVSILLLILGSLQCDTVNISEEVKNSDAVFTAKISSEYDDLVGQEDKNAFFIIDFFKGSGQQYAFVNTNGLKFERNKTYIIFASKIGKEYHFDPCSRTIELSKLISSDYTYLINEIGYQPCINLDQIGKNKNSNCTRELNPVCGCDGNSYVNTCFAIKSGVSKYTSGRCP